MKERLGIFIYRLMENVNGEQKLKLIPYRITQPIKIFALTFIK